jgi:ABC-type molybdate transport system ATPase subunit
MEYTLKRKYDQIDLEIKEHTDQNELFEIRIQETELAIFKLQQKIKRLRLRIEDNNVIINRKSEIIRWINDKDALSAE